MEVILVKDVPNLGHVGEQVTVKGGYGRNYLVPNKLAIPASVSNKRRLDHERAIASRLAAKAKAEAEGYASKVAGKTFEVKRKVGEQGKLFGSVTSADIAAAIAEQGVQVDKRGVVLAAPLKELGVFDVHVKLRSDVEFDVKVAIIGED
ncbi:MAG: 50S ribosomal protein L9 [Myxococcota bacterium]